MVEGYAWVSLYEDPFTQTKLSRELWSFQLIPDNSVYETSSLELAALMSDSQRQEAKQCYQEYKRERIKWLKHAADQGSLNAQSDLSWCYQNDYGLEN